MSYAYLCPAELDRHLQDSPNVGVEQWLGHYERVDLPGFRFIRWLRLVRESDQRHADEWCVYEKNHLDMGSEKFVNMDEFEEVGDPDEPEGKRSVFPSLQEALRFASSLGAVDGKYVKVHQIPFIYREFILSEGKPSKGINEWFS